MRFTIQHYDEGSKDWNTDGTTASKSLAEVVERVAADVTKDHQGKRVLLAVKGRYQKLVTIKYGHDKNVAATFLPLGRRLYRREKPVVVNDRYSEGIGKGISLANADRDERADRIAQSKQNAIAKYNRFRGEVKFLERAFGNTPRIYKCRKCGWYFATPGRSRYPACPSCRSREVKVVKV